MSALSSLVNKLKGGSSEESTKEETAEEDHSEHDHDSEEEKEVCEFC